MAAARPPFVSIWGCIAVLLSLLSFISTVEAQDTTTRWIQYTGNDGTIWLDDNRRPSLYTQDYGDCSGNSLINVTRFDAAYYKDNMTVQFHLEGNSPLNRVSLMMSISVFAYGESRFSLLFNPCAANIRSLCPLNSSMPIVAQGIIPIAQSDVANIPPIALTIPDFEGQAILRIFSNTTQSQIACFSAVLTNGATMGHPVAMSSILGGFAAVALIASVAVVVYGQSSQDNRQHYAHSLSVFVVFSVFQHIFFTGALSMNWPSVLVAFWSNYAWSAGIIYSKNMQNTINKFIGNNRGDITAFGSAATGQNAPTLGGGYQINQIYKRGAFDDAYKIYRRAAANNSGAANSSAPQFSWYGSLVSPGLPLPGNYSGFAGTLGQLSIPASNALITGLIWFSILLAAVLVSAVLLKFTIELLIAVRLARTDQLMVYRQRWLGFVAAAVLRTCYIAFFMVMFLTLFQFTLGGSTAVKAIAAVVLVLFFVGMTAVATLALYRQLRGERAEWIFGSMVERKYPARSKRQQAKGSFHRTWYPIKFTETQRDHPHDNENYISRFGWLSGRFRRSKWWFFAFWLAYEFVRACFFGGAAGHPLVQVFGLLVWEILALLAIVFMKPFESNRLNLLMVYLLGFSKVVTVALSAAFDPRFGLGRIVTTVIGIIIIIIQGILTICLLIAVVVGAVSSYMSLTRHEETMKPKSWLSRRNKYLAHIAQKATDQPPPPPPTPPPEPEKPKGPYFAVSAVRREPKIEDEDPENENTDFIEPRKSIDPEAERYQQRPSRAQSIQSRASTSTLPYGARRHRASWSARDLHDMEDDVEHGTPEMMPRASVGSFADVQTRQRAASMRSTSQGDNRLMPMASETHSIRGRNKRSASNPQRPVAIRKTSMVNEESEIH